MDPYLTSRVPRVTQKTLEEFSTYLKSKTIRRPSYVIVTKAVAVLRELVVSSAWEHPNDLIQILKKYAQYLPLKQSNETVVSNIVRRVLKIVREECTPSEGNEGLSVFFKADTATKTPNDTCDRSELKENICAGIEELEREVENSKNSIIKMALEHIHADEVILTYGYSITVRDFLLHGHKKRNFRLVVCESGPSLKGHQMARECAEGGVDTTLIADSAAFAMIHVVNKVIIGTHTIMADGALRALNGTHQLALAAKHYAVPVIVCAALYKLSPTHLCSYDHDAFNKVIGPEMMVPFRNANLHSRVLVSNPEFDYVPGDLVELYITNIGGHAPSYFYRIVSELYHFKDFNLDSSDTTPDET